MIRIRQMTAADLPLGLHLSRQAGWNQIEADWRRFLFLQPDGCFLAEWQGTPAATTVVIVFGSVAWVAMVLVEESVRGHGIGTALLSHALEFLDQRRVLSVRLDATPQGQPLYERLGFAEQFRLARYEGVLPLASDVVEVTEASAEQWEALAALDESVTGTNRRRLLLRFFAEQPGSVRCVQREHCLEGFLTARPGRRAFQLGPCLASPASGPLLLTDAWRRHAGQAVFLDIPVANEAATRWAEARGLAVQRHLTRMCRGVQRCERIEWLWASSGPEKG
jgi:GNAT superfamily N-acetyltransferase